MSFRSRFYVWAMLLFLVGFSSCSDSTENETPALTKTSHVFILNEGSFGLQDGTISTFAPENLGVQNKVYANANQVGIGGLINSGMLHENRLYAVVNSLDKIEIMDATTFEHIASITDQMTIPRQAIIANEKLYISNWGAYNDAWQNPDSYVLVIDLASNSVIQKIDVKNGAEYLLLSENELFVAQGQGSKISVIDTNTDKVTSEITVSARPRRMISDGKGNIWVISGDKKLDKINISSKSITQTIDIATENESPDGSILHLNSAGNALYFMAGESWPSTVTQVYKLDLSAASPSPIKLISKDNMYSLGIDPVDDTIYVGIAPDFSSNGVVVRFASDGAELNNFTAGIAPKYFVFK